MAVFDDDLITARKGSMNGKSNATALLRFALRASVPAALAVVVSGCSSLNIGSSDFACPGYPDGVQCMSTRDVYAATNDGGVPNSMGRPEELTQDTENHIRRPSSNTDPVRDPIGAYVAPRLPDKPVPVRTPAQVMRIWVAPWEDTNGDLNVSGYLYTEIEPRRWVLGDPAPSSNPVLSPLTVRSVSAKNAINQRDKQARPLMQADIKENSSDLDDNLQPEN